MANSKSTMIASGLTLLLLQIVMVQSQLDPLAVQGQQIYPGNQPYQTQVIGSVPGMGNQMYPNQPQGGVIGSGYGGLPMTQPNAYGGGGYNSGGYGGNTYPYGGGMGGLGGGFGMGGQFPQVSCPNVFSYQHDANMGGWYGLIITPKSRFDQEFDLEVNMTINKAVAQSDNIKLNVLSTQDEIFHGDAIKWSIRFPYQDIMPKLTQVKFNQQVICMNQPDPLVSGVTQTSMWAKAVIRTSAGTAAQPQVPGYGGVGSGSGYGGMSQPGYYPMGGPGRGVDQSISGSQPYGTIADETPSLEQQI